MNRRAIVRKLVLLIRSYPKSMQPRVMPSQVEDLFEAVGRCQATMITYMNRVETQLAKDLQPLVERAAGEKIREAGDIIGRLRDQVVELGGEPCDGGSI